MVVFEGQRSPTHYDEIGQYRPLDSESDLNRAWENQRKTYQQFVLTYDGYQNYKPVPGTIIPSPFVDKVESRGIRESYLNKYLMAGASVGGTFAILFMVAKAMLHA